MRMKKKNENLLLLRCFTISRIILRHAYCLELNIPSGQFSIKPSNLANKSKWKFFTICCQGTIYAHAIITRLGAGIKISMLYPAS